MSRFDARAEPLPEWRRGESWPVDVSTDPLLRKTFDLLRSKWNEVPFTAQDRVTTSQLEHLDDDELLARWTRGFNERARYSEGGWAHHLYRDAFRGKKVLDVGSGLGFDSIYFAEHGARVTFVDIVQSNLRTVERLCKIKGLNEVASCYLEDLRSIAPLPNDFDFIYAQGSLINAPLEVTRLEVAALLEHLPVGGRIVMLGYPRIRWERDGRLPHTEWGRVTDGGAPWMEWLDLDKVMWLLQPARFEVILYFETHNSDFNWFDLVRVDGTSTWLPKKISSKHQQPDVPAPSAALRSEILQNVQQTQADWGSSIRLDEKGVAIRTGAAQWSYACIFRLDQAALVDSSLYYWLGITISIAEGEFGIGFLKDQELIYERFVKAPAEVEVFLPLFDPMAEWLVLRNASPFGISQGIVKSARIFSQPKSLK